MDKIMETRCTDVSFFNLLKITCVEKEIFKNLFNAKSNHRIIE